MSQLPRRRVAVVGATGVAGQQFLVSLAEHPAFEVTVLAASPRSAGKPYLEAITDGVGQLRWVCEEPLPAQFAERTVIDAAQLDLDAVDLVFSCPMSNPSMRAKSAAWARYCPKSSSTSRCALV